MRRSLLLAILAASSIATAAVAQERTLVLSAYGLGQDAFKKHLYDPFQAACGCKLVVEVGNNAERIAKLEARKDNPEVDIAVLADFGALEAAEKGLLQPIDTGKLANYAKLHDFAKDPLGNKLAVGYTFYSTSIVYRSDKLPKISSWKDLYAPELQGKLALPNITTTQGPLVLFMTDQALGGKGGDLTKALDTLAAHKKGVVTFYERSSQVIQLLQQEEVLAAPVGRFAWAGLLKLKLPLAWAEPAEGQGGGMNVMTLVKGSKNTDLALKLMDMWLSEPVQKALAMDLVDSPANKEVVLPDDKAELLTYGKEQVASLRFLPPQTLLANRESWLTRWNADIAR